MNRLMPLLILVCLTSAARASEPFAGQIENGSWVKFYVTVEGDDANFVLETTIKAVGRTQEAGEDCQWIEVGSVNTASGERMDVYKLLFPETALKRGASITDVVRAWVLPEGSDQPEQADRARIGMLVLLFPGELQNVKRLDEKETVQVGGQSLECEVLEGEKRAQLGDQSVTMSHRLVLTDDVPFGLAGFRKEIRFSDAGPRIVANAQLLEKGEDAESLLPNSQ
jgi:hypothetical protein